MSSSDLAIAVRGLSKAYVIRHHANNHVTLTEAVLDRLRQPFKRQQRELFWALHDINVDAMQGEVLGVIGRNGAGKSTLLKVLTRITAPTAGRVDLWGRVGSLLEVGTGFHPELTGRENVYLNGSILGMTRAEITKQFDAIVEFAGVERFLDTPVKRYSSGMYVRLAFAVAAHLESEILLVDEVLAVGDADFQARCIEKMRAVALGGKTVILVSHQLASVRGLCDRAILLDNGRVQLVGSAESVVDHYLSVRSERATAPQRRQPARGVRVVSVSAEQPGFRPEEKKVIAFRLVREDRSVDRCFVSVVIRRNDGEAVAHCDSSTVGTWYRFDKHDAVRGTFSLSSPWLQPGEYFVDVFACNAGVLDEVQDATSFSVLPTLPYVAAPTSEVVSRDRYLPDYAFVSAPIADSDLD